MGHTTLETPMEVLAAYPIPCPPYTGNGMDKILQWLTNHPSLSGLPGYHTTRPILSPPKLPPNMTEVYPYTDNLHIVICLNLLPLSYPYPELDNLPAAPSSCS